MYAQLVHTLPKSFWWKVIFSIVFRELIKNVIVGIKDTETYWHGKHMEEGGTILTRCFSVLCAFEFYCAVITKLCPDALLTSFNIWLLSCLGCTHLSKRDTFKNLLKSNERNCCSKASKPVSFLLPVFFCLTVWDSYVLMR